MKKSLAIFAATLGASVFSFSSTVSADTVAVPLGQQGNTTVETPRRGLNKPQVEQRYGSPNDKVPAVGEPPISRWVYSDYTVYFDTDYVVHSVRHPSK
ncbi:MAG: phosphodiesterase [Pseudomonadales bacterium]|nr:phosphodiesterase [Pseudomonadales bacterium]